MDKKPKDFTKRGNETQSKIDNKFPVQNLDSIVDNLINNINPTPYNDPVYKVPAYKVPAYNDPVYKVPEFNFEDDFFIDPPVRDKQLASKDSIYDIMYKITQLKNEIMKIEINLKATEIKEDLEYELEKNDLAVIAEENKNQDESEYQINYIIERCPDNLTTIESARALQNTSFVDPCDGGVVASSGYNLLKDNNMMKNLSRKTNRIDHVYPRREYCDYNCQKSEDLILKQMMINKEYEVRQLFGRTYDFNPLRYNNALVDKIKYPNKYLL